MLISRPKISPSPAPLAALGLMGCATEGHRQAHVPLPFGSTDRHFYCSAAEQQRREDIGAELAPALQEVD